MHPIPFLLNTIIILFSIIIPQMTVIVLCGHWGNHLHWCSSLHPDNSQLIYFLVGVLSSFSYRKQKINLSSSCFLSSLFQLCTMYTVLFQLCTMYTVLFQLCTMDTVLIFFLAAFFTADTVRQFGCHTFGMYGMQVRRYHFQFQLCTTDTALCFSLQPFHYVYCKAIWMSSSMIVTCLVCMV